MPTGTNKESKSDITRKEYSRGDTIGKTKSNGAMVVV